MDIGRIARSIEGRSGVAGPVIPVEVGQSNELSNLGSGWHVLSPGINFYPPGFGFFVKISTDFPGYYSSRWGCPKVWGGLVCVFSVNNSVLLGSMHE